MGKIHERWHSLVDVANISAAKRRKIKKYDLLGYDNLNIIDQLPENQTLDLCDREVVFRGRAEYCANGAPGAQNRVSEYQLF